MTRRCLAAVAGLADDLDAVEFRQEGADACAEQVMVIGERDANRVRLARPVTLIDVPLVDSEAAGA